MRSAMRRSGRPAAWRPSARHADSAVTPPSPGRRVTMDDMALLVAEESRIEGPQSEVLHILYGSLFDTIRTHTALSKVEADQLVHRCLVRLQSRLAGAGFVVRDVRPRSTPSSTRCSAPPPWCASCSPSGHDHRPGPALPTVYPPPPPRSPVL